jgi:hypothetical protein
MHDEVIVLQRTLNCFATDDRATTVPLDVLWGVNFASSLALFGFYCLVPAKHVHDVESLAHLGCRGPFWQICKVFLDRFGMFESN